MTAVAARIVYREERLCVPVLCVQDHVLVAFDHLKRSCLGHLPTGILALARTSLEDVGSRVIPRLIAEAETCASVFSSFGTMCA